MNQSYRHLLTNSDDLHVSRTLACALGLNTSIFIRRIQEWLEYNEKHKQDKAETHFRDGRWWTFNTYANWVDDLKVFSMSTMRRAIAHGELLGIILSTSDYNKRSNDSTKWYAIDYEAFDQFMELWMQNGQPNGNRLGKSYKDLLAQWSQFRAIQCIVGLFKMNNRAVQDEQPKAGEAVQDEQASSPVEAAQDEQSVTRGVFPVESISPVESTGGRREITNTQAELILNAPSHMRRFELQSLTSHPILDAYSDAIGAPHIASESDKMACLKAQIAGYTPEDIKALVLSKKQQAKSNGGFKYPFAWMINDLAAFKANGNTDSHPPQAAPPKPIDPPVSTESSEPYPVVDLKANIEALRKRLHPDSFQPMEINP